MSLTQLNPPLPILTPRGKGLAHFAIDYGPEAQIFFTVFLDESREIWTYASRECRARENITMGRCDTVDPAAAAIARKIAELPDENDHDRLLAHYQAAANWDGHWSIWPRGNLKANRGTRYFDVLHPVNGIVGTGLSQAEAAKNALDRVWTAKPRPVDLESKSQLHNPFGAMEDGVLDPQTAEDWMRQLEWSADWTVDRGRPWMNTKPGENWGAALDGEFIVRRDSVAIGEGNTLADACRQAVLWKRNLPAVDPILPDGPVAAVPLSDYAADVANMPEEVRPEVPATAAEDSNPW